MTKKEYKQWLTERLAEAEAAAEATEDREPTAHEAHIVYEAKKHAYFLGLYKLSDMMPVRRLKNVLDCCLRLRECLEYLESPPPANYDDDTLIDVKEAARLLGYSEDCTRRLAKKGDITYVQKGRGRIKFRREAIDEYIAANSTGPRDIERSPAQTRKTLIVPLEPRYGFDLGLIRKNV